MLWITILAVNGALLRAFLVQEMFGGVILIFLAMQFAFWRLVRSRGKRFWIGFLIGGVCETLGLFACELFPSSMANRLLTWYTHAVFEVPFASLPDPVLDVMEDRWDLMLTVVYFVPELVVALGMCGLAVRVWLGGRGEDSQSH